MGRWLRVAWIERFLSGIQEMVRIDICRMRAQTDRSCSYLSHLLDITDHFACCRFDVSQQVAVHPRRGHVRWYHPDLGYQIAQARSVLGLQTGQGG